MIDYDQILPNLYVGTYPEGIKDVRKLKDQRGVTAVLNLQTDQDLRDRRIEWPTVEVSYKKLGMEVYRVPMRDFDYDDQRKQLPEAVKTLSKLLASGHIVYLYCNAGVSRSPLVAMAYLYWCRKLGLEEAIGLVRERRRCSPYEDLLEVDREIVPP